MGWRRVEPAAETGWAERFGVRSVAQLRRDYGELLRDGLVGARFQAGVSSLGHMRPDVGLAALVGLVPDDGVAPIVNFFDRTDGGARYTQRVTRRNQRDWRGGRLSYDEHDGVDFVLPPGCRLVAPASGTVVMVRDRFLRGGLTVAVDHGGGLLTQLTHCSRALVEPGQQVRRGEAVALSGHSGADMLTFFPWVPPHVHFSVWVHGRPVDPYLAAGEQRVTGTWTARNEPQPARNEPQPAPVDGAGAEPVPPATPTDLHLMRSAIEACRDARLVAELEALLERPGVLAATLEDALHHDRHAWPIGWHLGRVRPIDRHRTSRVQLSLPLDPTIWRGARPADTPWTRPQAGRPHASVDE